MKPFGSQINGGLYVMHARAISRAGLHQFARVVAMRAADDDDHSALLRKFRRGVLALLGRLANGVNETNFGIWKTFANLTGQFAHALDGLGRLCGNAESGALFQREDVRFTKHHVEFPKVFG